MPRMEVIAPVGLGSQVTKLIDYALCIIQGWKGNINVTELRMHFLIYVPELILNDKTQSLAHN